MLKKCGKKKRRLVLRSEGPTSKPEGLIAKECRGRTVKPCLEAVAGPSGLYNFSSSLGPEAEQPPKQDAKIGRDDLDSLITTHGYLAQLAPDIEPLSQRLTSKKTWAQSLAFLGGPRGPGVSHRGRAVSTSFGGRQDRSTSDERRHTTPAVKPGSSRLAVPSV